jgi:hypothetical protein
MNAIAERAAAYHATGWQPLAIRPNDKQPLRQGWQTATLPDTVAAIAASPGANIGLAVPAGSMVLDVDIKNDGPATLAGLEAEHGVLPATLSATTATGGRHFWFGLPYGVTVGNRVSIAPGLDIRAKGGYVVAPPSQINGKPYTWDMEGTAPVAIAPAWLITLASRPAAPPPKPPTDGEQTIREGQRNRTLFEMGAAMRGKGFPIGAIEAALAIMNAEHCSPPMDDGELATIAKSAARYAPDMQPWQAFAGNGTLERPQAPPTGYNLLTDADLSALPPMQWRIKGVLPVAGLAAVFGASGSGKSFLVLDALQALAAGADWFGHRVKPCDVLYAALEGEGGIAGRVNAYRCRHGSTAGNIRYLVQPFSLLDGGDIHDLAQAIQATGGAGVVVLDTLNRAAPGADENDSKSMGLIIAAAKGLQTLIGGLVLLVHHTGKDASKGLRGHSSLHAALDAAIEVRRDGDRREWLIAKSKDGEDGAAHPFTLDVVGLGLDEDGEAVTSCVVRQVVEVADSIRRVLPPKSGNQRAIWDGLAEVFSKATTNRPEGAPDALPLGRACLTLEVAIEQTRTRLVCEPKRQTERTQTAIRGLVDRGLLQFEGGFLWLK